MHKKISIIIALIFILSSCTPEEPGITQQQINTAQQNGQLISLYNDLSGQIKNSGKPASEQKKHTLNQIGLLIAEQKSLALIKQLENSPGPSPSIALLNKLQTETATIKPFNLPTYERTEALITEARIRTQQLIDDLDNQLQSLGSDAYERKLTVMQEISQLDGRADAKNRLDNLYNLRSKSITNKAAQLLSLQQFQAAYEVILKLPQEEKNKQSNTRLLSQIKAGISAEQIRLALQESDIEGAYMIYVHMLDNKSIFPDTHQDSLTSLGNLISQQCLQATKQQLFFTAFDFCRQSLLIQQSITQMGDTINRNVKNLNDALFSAAAQANALELPGVQLGYLYAIQQLDPYFPGLDRTIKKPHEIVKSKAVLRLSTAVFRDSSESQRFGEQISAYVTEYLFNGIPENIRIVERSNLNAIIRERKMDQKLSQSLDTSLDSAEFLIQGSILEANVDTENKQGKKTMRVQTGANTISNPAYIEWLKSHKAKDSGAPEKTIEKAIFENVTLGITQHRKIGLFSASYRLIRTRDAKVISTNTIKRQKEAGGESIEGLEIGMFNQPMKLANLESDLEILNTLSSQVAEQIASELAAKLSITENDFQKAAFELVDEDNLAEAAEQQAKAVVILESKNKDTGKTRQDLIKWSLQSGI